MDETPSILHELLLLLLKESITAGRALDMSPWSLLIWLYIDQHGPLQLRFLADWTGFNSGQITNILNRLEDAGYITRTPSPTHGRIILVAVRPESRARVVEALAGLDAVWRAVTRDTGDRSWHALVEALWDRNPPPRHRLMPRRSDDGGARHSNRSDTNGSNSAK